MKFKRTITLAILAAVLSANLVACVAEKDPNKDPNQTYTDANGNVVTQGPREDPNTDPAKLEYTNVSKTVYVKKKSTLKPIDSKEKSITLEAPARLECFAQSTDKSAEWLKVRYDGVEYYIARGRTTDDDIDEESFVSCDEEMTVCKESAKLRKYPSDATFSTELAYLKKGDKVEVVAKSTEKKWYKVKYTNGSKTVTGFVGFSALSEDYSKKFTNLPASKTVYVISESKANLRLEPIPGQDGGTIVGGDGVPRGTELTAVAEGNVNGLSWYMVYYKKDAGSASVKCYVAKSEVSEIRPDSGYTLDELLEKYKKIGYVEFSTPIIAYPYQNSINVRETPSASGKLVEPVELPSSLTLYAYGESLSGGATWCLVKTQNGKIGFAWYDSLTLDSTGKTLTGIPLSLDHLLDVYNFTEVSLTKEAKVELKLWSEPNGEENKVVKKVTKGTSVKIVAQGKDANNVDAYYIVEVDNVYYFALQSAFN